jgi:hypothetical protein
VRYINDVTIDQVVITLFLNIVVGNQNVINVELLDPFSSFAKLENTLWDGYLMR